VFGILYNGKSFSFNFIFTATLCFLSSEVFTCAIDVYSSQICCCEGLGVDINRFKYIKSVLGDHTVVKHIIPVDNYLDDLFLFYLLSCLLVEKW